MNKYRIALVCAINSNYLTFKNAYLSIKINVFAVLKV